MLLKYFYIYLSLGLEIDQCWEKMPLKVPPKKAQNIKTQNGQKYIIIITWYCFALYFNIWYICNMII